MPKEATLYNFIFFTNVLRILDERNMTKNELAERSGVSISFLSDLTTGKANPSLKVMEAIASALETSLPLLLESTDLTENDINYLKGSKMYRSLPDGFERISAVLPEHRAFVVKRWNEEAKIKIKEILLNSKKI